MIACLCRYAAALALLGMPMAAVAQVIPIIPRSELPGREQQRFTEPQAPRAQPRGPVITLPSTVAPEGAASVKLVVRAVDITGSTVYTADDFAPLYADLIGHEVTLQAVYDLAQRITAKYGKAGYVLSRAVVPPQNLNAKGATVHIQVVEGYVDKVVWPAKLSSYRNFFSDYEAKIVADRPANIRTLERYLLLLGDLPGFKVSTKLEPSKTNPAASTLVVEVTEKPVDLLGRLDNHGSKARGPFEFLGSATFNNLAHAHESFNVTYAGAVPLRELQYVSGIYRQVLTSEGLTFFADASYSWGKPGPPVDPALLYKTNSTIAEAGLSYPWLRSREANLAFTGLVFLSDANGIIGNPEFNINDLLNTRDRLRGFRIKADGDYADWLRGINQMNVTFSQGIEGLGSTNNLTLEEFANLTFGPVPSRALGRVDFSKVELTYSRLQPLVSNLSAFGSVYAQQAVTPLLSPELCGYGGRFYGRAFDPSALLGDSCWMAVGELRLDMPVPAGLLSQAQLYAFADHGHLTNIQHVGVLPSLGVPPSLQGSSLGAGVRFGFNNQINADLYVAKAFCSGACAVATATGAGTGAIDPVGLVGDHQDGTRFFFVVTARN
jgi:hemolysin activation/secretion protein